MRSQKQLNTATKAHLAALHVVALEAADEEADVVARLPLVQLLLEHLHACKTVGAICEGGPGCRRAGN